MHFEDDIVREFEVKNKSKSNKCENLKSSGKSFDDKFSQFLIVSAKSIHI